jgi:hypothetical protein
MKKTGKRSPGRPPRPGAHERAVFYLPVDLKRWLQHTAIDEGKDMSQVAREAIEDYRKRHNGKHK